MRLPCYGMLLCLQYWTRYGPFRVLYCFLRLHSTNCRRISQQCVRRSKLGNPLLRRKRAKATFIVSTSQFTNSRNHTSLIKDLFLLPKSVTSKDVIATSCTLPKSNSFATSLIREIRNNGAWISSSFRISSGAAMRLLSLLYFLRIWWSLRGAFWTTWKWVYVEYIYCAITQLFSDISKWLDHNRRFIKTSMPRFKLTPCIW